MSLSFLRTFLLAIMSAICEQAGMSKPNAKTLIDDLGIAKSYSYEILNGTRTPARALAIKIYRHTNWKPPVIAALDDADIATLERLEAQ